MRVETVTCDNCGRDISATANCVDYRLALVVERLPARSDYVTSMMLYPPIDRDAHFCGLGCLTKWIGRKSPTPAAPPADPRAR